MLHLIRDRVLNRIV